jgi:8-oxo-dGTP diphosphatase
MSDGSEQEGRFMVAVGAMIEHATSGKVLLLKRAETAEYLAGIWEDIMGRMKQFEEPEEALRREVREESGLEVEIVKLLRVCHEYRGERTAENEMVGIIYWCRTQSDRVILSQEHSAYQWVLPEEALGLVEHAGVRGDIEALMEEGRGRA